MGAFLSHATALEVLRSTAMRRRLEGGGRESTEIPEEVPTSEEIASLAARFPQLTKPINVTVSRKGPRGPQGLLKVHVSRIPLPEGSVIRLGDGLCCASPEHAAVQMAPHLTFLELVFLLGELMGVYAIAPGLEGGMFNRRQPLTSRERIAAHLEALGPVPGTAQVRAALAVACERSASPYETRLSMRLGLKPALGGEHLNVLSMNEPIAVVRLGMALAPGVRKPDVLLGATRPDAPFSGVSFDYNGNVHGTPEGYERDVRRHNEMLAVNFKNYVLTKQLYDDLDYMDDIMARARADLGLERPHLTKSEAERRRSLRQWLHDELELIDGVNWNGRERATRARVASAAADDQAPPPVDLVPPEAYGLE